MTNSFIPLNIYVLYMFFFLLCFFYFFCFSDLFFCRLFLSPNQKYIRVGFFAENKIRKPPCKVYKANFSHVICLNTIYLNSLQPTLNLRSFRAVLRPVYMSDDSLYMSAYKLLKFDLWTALKFIFIYVCISADYKIHFWNKIKKSKSETCSIYGVNRKV